MGLEHNHLLAPRPETETCTLHEPTSQSPRLISVRGT
jgi:hypothetical protein